MARPYQYICYGVEYKGMRWFSEFDLGPSAIDPRIDLGGQTLVFGDLTLVTHSLPNVSEITVTGKIHKCEGTYNK